MRNLNIWSFGLFRVVSFTFGLSSYDMNEAPWWRVLGSCQAQGSIVYNKNFALRLTHLTSLCQDDLLSGTHLLYIYMITFNKVCGGPSIHPDVYLVIALLADGLWC